VNITTDLPGADEVKHIILRAAAEVGHPHEAYAVQGPCVLAGDHPGVALVGACQGINSAQAVQSGCRDLVQVHGEGIHRYAARAPAEGLRTWGAIDGARTGAAVPVERARAVGGRERAQVRAIEADYETRRRARREDQCIVAKRATDGERVPLELD